MTNTPTTPDLFDLTIIGGGPTGLFAAYYAGVRHLKTKILDSLEELGGQLTTLYPEKYIFDVPGFPKIYARDLANNLLEQALQYNPAICLGETVARLDTLEPPNSPSLPTPPLHAPGIPAPLPAPPHYCITTDKARHYTKTILICAGVGAFQAKKLPLPDANPLEGRGVYYFVKSKAVFTNHRLLIVGGGDSAVDWALNLHDVAADITLIHRRNQFRAHEDSVRKLLASRVRVLTFWELKTLQSADGRLRGAVIVNNQTKEERTLELDSILVQVGFVSSLGPIRNWPVKISGSGILVDSHMETNLPGIFAAGDVASYDGKLKLIATGFGEAATAVNYAKTRVDPAARLFPGHSSEMTPQPNTVITL